MHVNSYFIESLVLCFSCGCDNGNFENGNLGWSDTLCSMNTPSRVIIGKQIQWSDQIGDQCDSDGPIQYDLPAIQQIIRLQLQTPPPSCATPPTTPAPSEASKRLRKRPDRPSLFPPPPRSPNNNWVPPYPGPNNEPYPWPNSPVRPVDYDWPYRPDEPLEPYSAEPLHPGPLPERTYPSPHWWNPYPSKVPSWRPPLPWPLVGPHPGYPDEEPNNIIVEWPELQPEHHHPLIPYPEPEPEYVWPAAVPYWVPFQPRPSANWYPRPVEPLSPVRPLSPEWSPDGTEIVINDYRGDDDYGSDRPWIPGPQWNPNEPDGKNIIIEEPDNELPWSPGPQWNPNEPDITPEVPDDDRPWSPEPEWNPNRPDGTQIIIEEDEDELPWGSSPDGPWYPDRPGQPIVDRIDRFEPVRPWINVPNWLPRPVPTLSPYPWSVGPNRPFEPVGPQEPIVMPPFNIDGTIMDEEPLMPVPNGEIDLEIIEDEEPFQPNIPADIDEPIPAPLEPPSINLVVITMDQGDGLLTVPIEDSLEIASEVDGWLQDHPTGQIVIIVTAEETSKPTWPEEVKDIFSINNPDGPTFVLVVDWSKYVFTDYTVTVEYSFEIARQLNEMIFEVHIPIDRLTIFAFGTSAHIAGYIGKLTEKMYGGIIYRIIALNPTGLHYTDVIEVEHRLSRYDAQAVVVIHTETVQIGHAEPIGTIDVYVNEPQYGQVWCRGDAQCSHESAIDIFILSYEVRPVVVTDDLTNEMLWGFPLDVPSDISGVFHLITDEMGVPQSLPPESWDVEILDEYPAVDISQFPERNVSNIMIIGQRTDGSEIVLPFDHPDPDLIDFLREYPLGEVFVILTEQPFDQWASQMKIALLSTPGPKYVLVVDWSPYVYPSYIFTVNAFSHLVAEAVYTFLRVNNVPLGLTEIIGFSTSAHVAGMVGSFAAVDGQQVSRITGLDPESRMWSNSPQLKLSEFQAVIVQVIHTNTRNWGMLEPLGHYDIYMFGGPEQPECFQIEDVDACSHLKAVEYYIASITNEFVAFEGELQGPQAVRTGDANIMIGFNLVPTFVQNFRIYVVEEFVPVNQEPMEIFDLPPVSNNWPPVQFVETIPGVVLHIHYYQGPAPAMTTVYFNRRHPLLMDLIRNLINLNDQNLGYLITDGEYLNDEEWSLVLTDKILNMMGDQAVVMRLDWTLYKSQSYSTSASYSRAIGNYVAQVLIELGIPPPNLHIIGFSIGAHIAGFIGKEIQTVTGNTQVARISALDPARPMFEHPAVDELSRLAPLDAVHVDAYHSNILVHGFTAPIGTIDFYINGGLVQPGCNGGDHLCAHYRSVLLFMISLDIRDMAIGVRYEDEGKLVFIANTLFADFGFFFENGQPGAYYLKTELVEPYLRPAERIAVESVNEFDIPGETNVDVEVAVDGDAPPQYLDVYKINVPPSVETFTEIIRIPGEPKQSINTYNLRSNFNSSRSA